jgi:hypothetical protein
MVNLSGSAYRNNRKIAQHEISTHERLNHQIWGIRVSHFSPEMKFGCGVQHHGVALKVFAGSECQARCGSCQFRVTNRF